MLEIAPRRYKQRWHADLTDDALADVDQQRPPAVDLRQLLRSSPDVFDSRMSIGDHRLDQEPASACIGVRYSVAWLPLLLARPEK